MNYSPNDNQLPFLKREGTTVPSIEFINKNSSIKKTPKNHNASNLRNSKPSHFQNPYLLFSIHKYQELARSKGKVNRNEIAHVVQKAWNELTPNERFHWFQNADRDRRKQPTITPMMLEIRASRGLMLKRQHSLNLSHPRFKEIGTDNNENLQRECSSHHNVMLRKQNSFNFEDQDSRETENINEFLSSNRSMFVRSRSSSDVYQSSSNNSNYQYYDVCKKLLNEYNMIIDSAAKERDNITVNFCNSQNNNKNSVDQSLHSSKSFSTKNMGGEELARPEYEALMKGYKDIIDNAMMQKTTLEFKLMIYHRNNNLQLLQHGNNNMSTVTSKNVANGNFDDRVYQAGISYDSLPPLETLLNEYNSQQQDFGHESMRKSDLPPNNNVSMLQNCPNQNDIGIISDVRGCIANIDIPNNNINHTSINNGYSLLAENIMTTTKSDRNGSIPKVSLHRRDDTNSNKFRSHHDLSSIPTVSLHREEDTNIALEHKSNIDMKRRKLSRTEMDNNNIASTTNNNHQLCQQTWMYAKCVLSPMLDDDDNTIKKHPPQNASTTSAAAALTSTDEDEIENMDDNPICFMEQFDNNHEIHVESDEDDNLEKDGTINWLSQYDLDESFH